MTTVCLCGSARFEAQFKEASKQLGLMGIVVIGLSSYPSENAGEKNWYGPDEKEMLDLVHLEKIRMADAVLVIDGTRMSGNVSDAYVGFSTAREILWSKMQDRPIISFSSSSGWGNIYELIQHRFSEEWLADHSWLIAHAHATLKINAGVDVVKEMTAQGEHDILHGGLSAMACQIDGAAGTYAQLVLEAAGLDPLSSIPPNVPVFMGLGSKDVEKLEGGNRDKEFSRYNDTASIEDLCPGLSLIHI